MTAGPKNDFLRRRQEQINSVRFCPFSIRPPVESTVVGADGKPAEPRINASPCLGDRCVAFAIVQAEPGKTVGECRLCMLPNLLSSMAPMLLAHLDRIALAEGAPALTTPTLTTPTSAPKEG